MAANFVVRQIAMRRPLFRLQVQDQGKTLEYYALPLLTDVDTIPMYDPVVFGTATEREADFNSQQNANVIPAVPLNDEQQFAFNQIWAAVERTPIEKNNREPNMLFLRRAGKIILYNQLIRLRLGQQLDDTESWLKCSLPDNETVAAIVVGIYRNTSSEIHSFDPNCGMKSKAQDYTSNQRRVIRFLCDALPCNYTERPL